MMKAKDTNRSFFPVLILICFVVCMTLISSKLYTRKIVFEKEIIYDMSVYYEKYPQNMGFCGNATASEFLGSNGESINGRMLFKANCASCHKANVVLIGPALQGARQRWADAGIPGKIYEWVRNPKKVLDEGHPYVKELVNKFSTQALMTPQALSDEEIDAVLMYMGN